MGRQPVLNAVCAPHGLLVRLLSRPERLAAAAAEDPGSDRPSGGEIGPGDGQNGLTFVGPAGGAAAERAPKGPLVLATPRTDVPLGPIANKVAL